MQRPYSVGLCRLRRCERYHTAALVTSDNWPELAINHIWYSFHCNYAEVAAASDLPNVSAHRVHVIEGLVHHGGKLVIARTCSMPLDTFLFFLPQRPPRSEQQQRVTMASDRHVEQMLDLFPWLLDVEHSEATQASATTSSQAGSAATQLGDGPAPELDDDVIEQGMRALEDARTALQAVPRSTDDFRTRAVTRSCLAEQRGNALQAIVGEHASQRAREFCGRRHVQLSVSFSPEVYGHEACGVLARAWCHRVQHFLNEELSQPAGTAYTIDADAVAAYKEPAEFARLAETAAAQLRRRVQQIRGIFGHSP